MEAFLVAHPIATLFITACMTLLAKYIWDRFLAQSSRVTRSEFDGTVKNLREECDLKRSGCIKERVSNKTYFEGLIKQQAGCLEDAFEDEALIEKRRSITRKSILCIMMSQLKICEALNNSGVLGDHRIDCTDISRMMVDMGVIE